MEPTAIRNKKTGRFLIAEPETGTSWDWGYDGQDEKMMESTTKHLSLRDSEYSSVLFLTNDENLLKDLLQKGKSTYPDVRIDFGWGMSQFVLGDLEAVVLLPSSQEVV